MEKNARTLSNKAGLPPGALVHIGEVRAEEVKVSVVDYSPDHFIEKVCDSPQESFEFRDKETVSWINVDGLHRTEIISALGEHFNMHPLMLEDVLNTGHRPKAEEFEDQLFLTLKMLGMAPDGKSVISEQLSLVLGKGWVFSFQEQEGDIFDTLYLRLKENKGNFRRRGADYLFYRFIDTVVDNYFHITEHFSEKLEEIEEKVLDQPDEVVLEEIQGMKRQLSLLRKTILPLREAILSIRKDSSELFDESTFRYLDDVYEHIIQIYETIEIHRETVASIMDLYLSGVSNKMNQVMQVLTIIATIFIPLSFIAGIYGMNFVYIPELSWKYGYFAFWGFIILVIIGMVIYFKRKKWL